MSFWSVRLLLFFLFCHFFLTCIGTTETLEGGDQLSAGLRPLVVFCQSARRRAGEMFQEVIHWEKSSVCYSVTAEQPYPGEKGNGSGRLGNH